MIAKKIVLDDRCIDAQFVTVDKATQILAAVQAAPDGAGFADVRAALAALNLVDSKGRLITAERLPDGVIHQVCIDNGIDVRL